MSDGVSQLLEQLGFGQYAAVFAKNDIDEEVLAELSEADLEKLGMTLGHRKKLLKAIAALPDASAEPPQKPPTSGERRQVTVLFADLSGFTKLSNELGAEETHTILNRYFAVVDAIIERYGGTIDKHIGDSVMSLFGSPVAHTNDPERAVRAACDIHENMNKLSLDLGRSLRAHIGIASGQVVASGTGSAAHQEYTVTGDSVNLASRLDDLAGPGETLISKAVYDAVSRIAICSAKGALSVKGLKQSVQVWALNQIDADTSPRHLGAFVGRQMERRQFSALLQGCVEQGRGHNILVRGEPGIGKTRLVGEFATMASEEGFTTHRSLVLDFGVGKGQDMIGSLVRSLLGIRPGGGKEVRRAAAISAIGEGHVPEARRMFLDDLLDLPQDSASQSLYDEMENKTREEGKCTILADLVRAATRHSPLLVVIEDIHWADQATLQHLHHLAGTIAGCPSVLVMTSRIEGVTLEPGWLATLGGAPLTAMELQTLRMDETQQLAANLGATEPQQMERYVARSEGNPLYLEQLMQSAMEAQGEDLPETLQGLVLARMDRLPRKDKEALQAASVVGQKVSIDALQHLISDGDYDCETLVRHRLLRPEGSGYLFDHALIRDGVYSSLLRSRQKDLHARAADWFASKDPVLRAEHLDRAEDSSTADAYLTAAQNESDHHRLSKALKLARRGLELATEPETRFALGSLEGELLETLEQFEESLTAFKAAHDAAGTEKDRCTALLGQAFALIRLDRHRNSEALLKRAETLATEQNLTEALARIHRRRATIEFIRGNERQSFEESEKALRFAEACESPLLQAEALSCLGDAEAASSKFISARDYYERCIALCQEHGFRRFALMNTKMLGDNAFYRGEISESRHIYDAVIAEASKLGNLRAEMFVRHMLAFLCCITGRPDEALKESQMARELILRLNLPRNLMDNHIYFAMSHRTNGDSKEAMKHLEKAEAIARELDIVWSLPWVFGERALATDDSEERNRCLDAGEELLTAGIGGFHTFEFYRPALEAALKGEDWHRVDRLAELFAHSMVAEPMGFPDFVIRRAKAIANAARMKKDEKVLRDLRAEAEAMGVTVDIPAIDVALDG